MSASVEMKARCTGCRSVFVLTERQIAEARDGGPPLSDCCFMPMVVTKVTFDSRAKAKKANGAKP